MAKPDIFRGPELELHLRLRVRVERAHGLRLILGALLLSLLVSVAIDILLLNFVCSFLDLSQL